MNAPVAISAMASKVPPAPVLAVLSRYRREDIESFVAIAIDLLDLADGDPDLEDATDAEDEGLTANAIDCASDGPGCDLADAGGQCDEDGINTAFESKSIHTGAGCFISDPDRPEQDV
jgi:hypothetical protein